MSVIVSVLATIIIVFILLMIAGGIIENQKKGVLPVADVPRKLNSRQSARPAPAVPVVDEAMDEDAMSERLAAMMQPLLEAVLAEGIKQGMAAARAADARQDDVLAGGDDVLDDLVAVRDDLANDDAHGVDDLDVDDEVEVVGLIQDPADDQDQVVPIPVLGRRRRTTPRLVWDSEAGAWSDGDRLYGAAA